MPVTETDMRLLSEIARYYVLTREQLQRLTGHDESSGRTTRRHLSKLCQAGYISRHSIPVALPGTNGAAPIYYATKAGAELLAQWFDDERYLALNTRQPRGDRLSHWIALNETRIIIERAIAQQNEVRLDGWINEWETINKDAAPTEQFTLQTQLSVTPPLSCSPDAAMLLSLNGHSKVYYIERDRGTSSPHQVAARKTRGYAALAMVKGHLRHFPNATVPSFGIMFVTPTSYRCQQLAKELRHRDGKEFWLMVDEHELTSESFLSQPIFLSWDGKRDALVAPASSAAS